MTFIVRCGRFHVAKVSGKYCVTTDAMAPPLEFKYRAAANRQAFYFRKHHKMEMRVEEIDG